MFVFRFSLFLCGCLRALNIEYSTSIKLATNSKPKMGQAPYFLSQPYQTVSEIIHLEVL